MPRFPLVLLVACLLPLASPGQDITRRPPGPVAGKPAVRSKIQANDIAAAPAKFEGRTLQLGGRDLAGIKPDGERFTGHAAGRKDFAIHLTPGAHDYLLKCRKAGIVPVFEGEVKRAATGQLALFIARGLNTAR